MIGQQILFMATHILPKLTILVCRRLVESDYLNKNVCIHLHQNIAGNTFYHVSLLQYNDTLQTKISHL